MKWILCVTVLICVFSQIVNGAKTNKSNKVRDPIHLEVDSMIYKPGEYFLEEGINKRIACKGKVKNQKIEWYDPQGNLVTKNSKNRVFVTEPLSIMSSVYLVFTTTEADDSGVWECRSGDRVEKVPLCIMDPSDFPAEPKEITMDERRSITLTCQTNGNPEPRIQWYKDGELLEEDGEKFYTGTKYNQHGLEGLLTIRSLTPEDMGVYVCEAVQQNPMFEDCNNSAIINITLYVNHAPKFNKNKKDFYFFVEDGENVTIVCDPSAYPKPQFRWFTGNMAKELSSKQFTLSDDGSSLHVIANSQNYNQKFNCKAENEFGEEYMTYRILRMQEPDELSATSYFVPHERTIYFNITWDPEIIFPVDRIDIQYLEKTTIGEPKEWQWESAKIITYSLQEFDVNGAKTNKSNKVRDPIHLEVDSMIYKPGEYFLEEGINKRIACKGKVKNQKIEWYDPQGNLVTKNSKNRVFVTEPLSIMSSVYLVFTTTEADDSGVWECRSGDRVEKVPLCIMDPSDFPAEPKEITMDERRSITLTCQTNGNPEPRIQWYKDGELLEEDGEKFYTGTKYNQHGLEGLLTIRSLTPEDMGVYVCEAVQQNPMFEDCNNSAIINITLYVNHAPKFNKNKKDFYFFVEDGENVTIVCDPSAYPKPQFRWFTGNMAKELSSKQFTLSDDGSSLHVIANSQNYNQKFNCKAENEFGEEYMTYRILRMQEPDELSATSYFVPHERTIYFNITWDPEIIFPVDRIDIQYLEKTTIGEPKEWQWESAKIITYSLQEFDDPVPMRNLKINTEYWVRLRAGNERGDGPWSHQMLVSTAYENESNDVGIFLGVIVTAVIVVFGAGCLTLIKKL